MANYEDKVEAVSKYVSKRWDIETFRDELEYLYNKLYNIDKDIKEMVDDIYETIKEQK